MPSRTTRQMQLRRQEQQQSTSTETANGASLQQQQSQQATSVETSTTVTQQQSQELLQSLLLGSLSSILYVRDLFPRDTFEIRLCDVNSEEPWSHKAWASGKVKAGGDDSMPLYVLDRSKDYGAQTFVDWIEKSALDAIKFGFLRELQLRIFEDPDHQENILELWAFTISYHTPPGSNQAVVTNIDLNGPNTKRASLKNLKIGLVEFVKGISGVATQLPDLPDHRYFKFKFVYTENCPEDYHAPGFHTGSATPFPLDNGLLNGAKRPVSYHGGHHRVDLAVSHPKFPANLELAKHALRSTNSNTRKIARELAQENHETLNGDSERGLHQTTVERSGASLPHTSTAKIAVLQPNNLREKKPHEVESGHVAPFNTEGGDQSHHDQRQEQAFDIAPQRQIITGGSGKSEFPSQDKRERANLIEMRQKSRSEEAHDTQSVGPTQISHGSGEKFQDSARTRPTEGRMRLTEAKTDELNKKMGMTDSDITTVGAPKAEGKDIVLCQCGTTDEEDEEMIFCEWCHTWQHCHCYGFLGGSDPRIPLKHACYSCLFDGEEGKYAKDVMNKLEGHALLRRGIHVIKEEGYRNQDRFHNALGVRDKKTASEIINRLKKEAVAVPSPGSKKREFSKTGKPTYQIINTEPGQSAMNNRFFNPLFLIEDYYTLENQAFPSPLKISQIMSQNTASISAGPSAILDAEQLTNHSLQPARPIGTFHKSAKGKQRAVTEQDQPEGESYNLRKRRTSTVNSYSTPKRKSRAGTAGSRASLGRSAKRVKHDSPGIFFSRLRSPESVQSLLPQTDDEL